jgi:hypothetical protein
MIGKLHKKGDHWVIRYEMGNSCEISLHPDDEKLFMGVKEWNDDDIHFKIVPYMHDTFVAKVIDDDDFPEPNESLKLAKEEYDKLFHKSRSIGPSNVDEWDPEYMDGQNKDTWFDELDINPQWKKQLKKYNLSPEVWNVICQLYNYEKP